MNSTPAEDFLLLLLSDSNLPLGGFHFSAGLESTTKHGFLPRQTTSFGRTPLEPFIRSSLQAHARSTLAFVGTSYERTASYLNHNPDSGRPKIPAEDRLPNPTQQGEDEEESESEERTVRGLVDDDVLYEVMTSNQVTRRGSKTQGIGMLTIWQKAFRQPAYLPLDELADGGWKECAVRRLMDRLKKEIREGRMMGHLPVCWGVLCAVLGLTLERTLHLHLYLHTRSILSSSVRLNQTGPYHAQTILLYTIRPLIEAELALYRASPGMGGVRSSEGIPRTQEEAEKADEQESEAGPMNCWPLGEILQGRHDVMHSRMFNT